MAIPSITTTNPGYEQIAAGASYTRSFSATNSPTSWAVVNLPAGLSFNTSTGDITGSPTATEPTASAISVTATNGDGTSAALTWLIVVLPSVTGTTQGEWVVPLNLDIGTRRLSLPGIGTAQPADQPPAAGEAEAVLGSWIEGERFILSLGLVSGGVLQQLTPNRIKVMWRENNSEQTIELQEDELDVTESGSGTTARYEIPVHVDSDLVFAAISNGERINGTRRTGLLQILAESSNDDRDFSAVSSDESLGTFTESSSVNDTFALTIDTESADAREYDVTINAVFPTDTALNCQVVRRVSLTYSGGTYVLGTTSGSTSDTGSSTVEANWDSTLTNTSLTATATGISVGTTVAGSAQKADGVQVVIALEQFTVSADSVATGGTGTESYLFKNSGGTTIYTWTLTDGEEIAQAQMDLETGLTESVAAYWDDGADEIRFVFDDDTAVASVVNGESATTYYPSPNTDAAPTAPSYSDAYVRVTVTGATMPGNSLEFLNNPARFQLVGSFDS